LLQALFLSHEKIDKRQELVLILDNASWHNKLSTVKTIEHFNAEMKRQGLGHRSGHPRKEGQLQES
jgi:hypothetical protein